VTVALRLKFSAPSRPLSWVVGTLTKKLSTPLGRVTLPAGEMVSGCWSPLPSK